MASPSTSSSLLPPISKVELKTFQKWFSDPVTRYRFLRLLRERLVFALKEEAKERELSKVKMKIRKVLNKKK